MPALRRLFVRRTTTSVPSHANEPLSATPVHQAAHTATPVHPAAHSAKPAHPAANTANTATTAGPAVHSPRTRRAPRRPAAVAMALTIILTALYVLWAVPAQAAQTVSAVAISVNAQNQVVTSKAIAVPVGALNADTAPAISQTEFRYATWVHPGVTPANAAASDLLTSENVHRLKISSLAMQSADSLLVTPDTQDALPGNQKVALTAPTGETASHLVLVYQVVDASKSVSVQLTDAVRSFSGTAYDPANGKASFAQSDGTYIQRFTMSFARGKKAQVTLKDGTGTVTSRVVRDDSSTDETVQDIEIKVAAGTTAITVDAVDFTASTAAVSVYTNGQDTTGSGYMNAKYNIPSYNGGSGWQGNLDPLSATSATTSDYCWMYRSSSSECPTEFSKADKTSDRYISRRYGLLDWQNPVNTDTNRRITFEHIDTTMNAKKGATLSFYIDATPEQPPALTQSAYPFIQDWLGTITLNKQTFVIPTPVQCTPPNDAGEYLPQNMRYGSVLCSMTYNFYGWKNGAYASHRSAYQCNRLWIMGGMTTTSTDASCGITDTKITGAKDTAIKETKGGVDYFKPRLLLSRAIDYGANAGSTLRVSLVNARSMCDSAFRIAQNTVEVGNDGLGSNNSGVRDAHTCSRWRTRYLVELVNVSNPQLEVGIRYAWSSQNAMILEDSEGVQAVGNELNSLGPTSLSVYARPDTGRPVAWTSLCQSEKAPTISRGAGCSYVFAQKTSYDKETQIPKPAGIDTASWSNMLAVGLKAQNGYTNPVLKYAATRPQARTGAKTVTLSTDLSGASTNTTALTPSNPIPDSAGDYPDGLYAYMTKTPVYEKTASGSMTDAARLTQLQAMAQVPLSAGATLVNFPVHYYEGDHEQKLIDSLEGTTVNVKNLTLVTVPGIIPEAPSSTRVFDHWVVNGYKDGNIVGTIYSNVKSQDLLNFADPRFQNGSRAFTTGTGKRIIDEIRIEAVYTDIAQTSDHDTYAYHTIVRSTGSGSSEGSGSGTGGSVTSGNTGTDGSGSSGSTAGDGAVTIATDYYHAIAGLTATVSPENSLTYDGRSYALDRDASVLSLTLGAPSDPASVLHADYTTQDVRVTVIPDLPLTGGRPRDYIIAGALLALASAGAYLAWNHHTRRRAEQ